MAVQAGEVEEERTEFRMPLYSRNNVVETGVSIVAILRNVKPSSMG